MDPHILAGLATLIVLELVLGIDNLVFIAILANKLPAHQRDKARIIGLGMAMAIRLALLAVMSHIIALTRPLFEVAGHVFSWRDVILIGGGLFLLWKATKEIHERLEGHHETETGERRVPSFGATILQIVVLDAIFSLDSIITAVGMVDQLWVMMTAVIVSMAIMITASKPLTRFVSQHPTVIILCLSFLLLIGCSLIADGFGFHFPKSYLYAAIGFSLLIELLNQIGGFRKRKHILRKPMRERTADAILRLITTQDETAVEQRDELAPPPPIEAGGLHEDETRMIRGVISLGSLQARSIMTLRPEVVWVDVNMDDREIIDRLVESGRTRVLLCEETLDNVIGLIEVRDALRLSMADGPTDLRSVAKRPLYQMETVSVTNLIDRMRREDQRFAVVTDEHGSIEGVVTTTDIFAVIAGDLADDEDDHMIVRADDGTLAVNGMARVSDVEEEVGVAIAPPQRDYETISGHLQHITRSLPEAGVTVENAGFRSTVEEVDNRRIERVRIEKIEGAGE